MARLQFVMSWPYKNHCNHLSRATIKVILENTSTLAELVRLVDHIKAIIHRENGGFIMLRKSPGADTVNWHFLLKYKRFIYSHRLNFICYINHSPITVEEYCEKIVHLENLQRGF